MQFLYCPNFSVRDIRQMDSRDYSMSNFDFIISIILSNCVAITETTQKILSRRLKIGRVGMQHIATQSLIFKLRHPREYITIPINAALQNFIDLYCTLIDVAVSIFINSIVIENNCGLLCGFAAAHVRTTLTVYFTEILNRCVVLLFSFKIVTS